MPEDHKLPLMDMLTAAIAAHEAFTSFKKAGFTPQEALELTKAMVSSS